MAAVRGEMQIQGSQLRALIAESRAETLRWMIGLLIAQAGLIVGLLRILPSH